MSLMARTAASPWLAEPFAGGRLRERGVGLVDLAVAVHILRGQVPRLAVGVVGDAEGEGAGAADGGASKENSSVPAQLQKPSALFKTWQCGHGAGECSLAEGANRAFEFVEGYEGTKWNVGWRYSNSIAIAREQNARLVLGELKPLYRARGSREFHGYRAQADGTIQNRDPPPTSAAVDPVKTQYEVADEDALLDQRGRHLAHPRRVDFLRDG